jgi:predicted transposase YbfD/YdcC
VVPRLLEQVQPLLAGRLVSGYALYCQKTLCRQLRAAGAHYLFAVNDNQPSLHEDVVLLFTEPPLGVVVVTAQTITKHGGRLERRQVPASACLAAYLQEADWPDAGLVLEVVSCVSWPRHPTRPVRHERRYFVSSLPATTPPATVLHRVRVYWHIENRLHWPRDVTLGEDASQIRSGRARQALAAMRNAVLSLLHGHQVANAAAAIRTCAWSPPTLLFRLLGIASP